MLTGGYIEVLILKHCMADPVDLCCPITTERMHDPVKTIYGHVFEHHALAEWVRHTPTCPLTRQPLSVGDWHEDTAKKAEIMVFQQQCTPAASDPFCVHIPPFLPSFVPPSVHNYPAPFLSNDAVVVSNDRPKGFHRHVSCETTSRDQLRRCYTPSANQFFRHVVGNAAFELHWNWDKGTPNQHPYLAQDA